MLFLLSGTDTFRMLERSKSLERDFLQSHPAGQKFALNIDENWDEAARSLLVSTLSPGLFATPYVIAIRGAETLDDKGGEWLADTLARKSDLVLVVLTIVLGGKKKLPKWWNALLKKGDVKAEVCGELTSGECAKYIDSVLATLDPELVIEPRAKTWLVEALSGDTGRLTQELTRLALSAHKQMITLAQVTETITPTREVVTFQALDALVRGERARAIALFRQEETEPDAPFALLGLCAWQVRRLIAIKELAEMGKTAADIARELKTSPYPIQKTLPLVSRFSFPRLRRALILLADFDQALKTGRLQPGVALDLFVWKF